MNVFQIIGESKPDKLKLKSGLNRKVTELPKRTVRKMVDNGFIQVENPESLYLHL